MRFETVKVSPKQARAWLEASQDQPQRAINRGRVERFAADMRHGRWLVTHQPIAVSTEGKLIDGQHRCAAVVLANRTVTFMVCFDADPATFVAVDAGAARSPADALKIQGFGNTAVKASAARLLLAYDQVKGSPEALTTAQRHAVSTGDIMGLWHSDRAELLSAGEPVALRVANGLGKYGLKSWGVVAYVIFAESKVGPSARAEFFERLGDGALLGPGSPILALRNWLTRDSGLIAQSSQMRSTAAIAHMIKAFNQYVAGERVQVSQFKIGREPMPTVIDPDPDRLMRLEEAAEHRERAR